jgi:hypothetical protein
VRLEFFARNGQAKTLAALEEYSTIWGGFQRNSCPTQDEPERGI